MRVKLMKIRAHLPCDLTDDEVRAKGERLATLFQAVQQKEGVEKERHKSAMDEIKEDKLELCEVANEVHTKMELRLVDVNVIGVDSETVEYIRLDTGVNYETRIMTPDEVEKAYQLQQKGMFEKEDELPPEPGA